MALNLANNIFSQEDVRETVTNSPDTAYNWNLNHIRYSGEFTLTADPQGIYISNDGRKMYVSKNDSPNSYVYEYTLSTPWSVSTATYVQTLNVSARDQQISGIFFKPDGTKLFFGGLQNTKIYQYALGTAWDLSTAAYEKDVVGVSSLTSITFRPDGLRLFTTRTGAVDRVNEYSFGTTAWDLSALADVNYKTFVDFTSVFFDPTGTYMFNTNTSATVLRHALTTTFNVTTATQDTAQAILPVAGVPAAVFFNLNGSKMYVVYSGKVYEFTIKKSWR